MLVSDQEDSTHKRFVVVQGVKVGSSQMEGAVLRKHIMQVRIDRKQVNIMHGHVVTLSSGLQVPDIDQGSTVEPALHKSRQRSATELHWSEQRGQHTVNQFFHYDSYGIAQVRTEVSIQSINFSIMTAIELHRLV